MSIFNVQSGRLPRLQARLLSGVLWPRGWLVFGACCTGGPPSNATCPDPRDMGSWLSVWAAVAARLASRTVREWCSQIQDDLVTSLPRRLPLGFSLLPVWVQATLAIVYFLICSESDHGDLARPWRTSPQQFWLMCYVILSRATSLEGFLAIRLPTVADLNARPPQYLLDEIDRLLQLERTTTRDLQQYLRDLQCDVPPEILALFHQEAEAMEIRETQALRKKNASVSKQAPAVPVMRKRLRTKTTVAEIVSAAPAPSPVQAQKPDPFSPEPPLPPKALSKDAAEIAPLDAARPKAAPCSSNTAPQTLGTRSSSSGAPSSSPNNRTSTVSETASASIAAATTSSQSVASTRAAGIFSDQWQNFKECIQIASDASLRSVLQTFCDNRTSSKQVIYDADVKLLRQSLDTPELLLDLVKKFRDVPISGIQGGAIQIRPTGSDG